MFGKFHSSGLDVLVVGGLREKSLEKAIFFFFIDVPAREWLDASKRDAMES